jgi:hypothetical protein
LLHQSGAKKWCKGTRWQVMLLSPDGWAETQLQLRWQSQLLYKFE